MNTSFLGIKTRDTGAGRSQNSCIMLGGHTITNESLITSPFHGHGGLSLKIATLIVLHARQVYGATSDVRLNFRISKPTLRLLQPLDQVESVVIVLAEHIDAVNVHVIHEPEKFLVKELLRRPFGRKVDQGHCGRYDMVGRAAGLGNAAIVAVGVREPRITHGRVKVVIVYKLTLRTIVLLGRESVVVVTASVLQRTKVRLLNAADQWREVLIEELVRTPGITIELRGVALQ